MLTTILAGVAVFVIGQIFLKWIVEPIQGVRQAIALVEQTMVKYRREYAGLSYRTPGGPDWDKVSADFDTAAAVLRSSITMVPWYDKVAKALSLPSSPDVLEAAVLLIRIAGGDGRGDALNGDEHFPKIRDLLRLSRLASGGLA